MIFQARCYSAPIVVVDHGSDFAPHQLLLSRLAKSGIKVIYLPPRGARTMFFDWAVFDNLPPLIAVTDADLKFNPHLPSNFLDVLARIAVKYDKKAGFALDISSSRLR
jgi:hypothetical protein